MKPQKNSSLLKKSFLLIALFLAGFFPKINQSLANTELAKVNSSVITFDEFNKKFQENLKFFQFKSPTKKNVLDDLIKRELGIQEAKRLGLEKDPVVVERINTVLYHALLEKELGKDFEKIQISENEAKSFYQKNPEVRTSHIFVSLPPNATPEQDRKAYEKIKRIQDQFLKEEKANFTEVAQKYSEGVAAPMGGDLDYQTKDKLDPAYYEAAIKLGTPGKVSGIVKSQFGYHVIKLTAIRDWNDVDRAQIKRILFDDKRNKIYESYMAQLKSKAKVSIKEDLLQ